jgi:hypothetical protein
MPAMMRWLALFTLVALGTAGCSCERVVPKTEVKGTVTVDGQPLADGDVIFKTPATASIDVLKVTGGQFAGPAEIGKRNVEIYAYKTVPMQPGSPGYDPAGLKVNTLPDKYNARTELSADVVQGGDNSFKFDLKSGPEPPQKGKRP